MNWIKNKNVYLWCIKVGYKGYAFYGHVFLTLIYIQYNFIYRYQISTCRPVMGENGVFIYGICTLFGKNEPPQEKTNNLYMQQQRRRSASR